MTRQQRKPQPRAEREPTTDGHQQRRRPARPVRATVAAVATLLFALLPARQALAAPDPPPGERSWPVASPGGREPPTVLRGFEPPPAPWAAGHRGADLAAVAGTPVRAAAPGRVVFAGTVAGQGVVSIELTATGQPPLRTTYEPVHATVAVGTQVTAGQPVAVLQTGPFHCPAGCLHWGLLRGETYLDPLSLMPANLRRRGPSRLLPVFGIRPPEAPTAWHITATAAVGGGAGLLGAALLGASLRGAGPPAVAPGRRTSRTRLRGRATAQRK